MPRILVVTALAILSWITYLDRAAISSVKDPIGAELQLDDKSMGAVFSAFALGYAVGQIPTGWAADRFGPRILLTSVVMLWSILTGLTGLAQSFVALMLIRFLFGLAEAGAYPGTARAIYGWLPASEHGRANASRNRAVSRSAPAIAGFLISAVGTFAIPLRPSAYLAGSLQIVPLSSSCPSRNLAVRGFPGGPN